MPVAIRQIVRVLQARRGLRDDLHHLGDGKKFVHLGRALGNAAQVRPVDELHRDEVVPVRFAEIEDRDDVRMVELRGEAGLVEEHVDELLVAGEMRKNPLEADLLLEPRCSSLPREIDLRHSTGGDELHELVRPERSRHRAERNLA